MAISVIDKIKKFWPFGQVKMTAIGVNQFLPSQDARAFTAKVIARPSATGQDLLIKVLASAINPVDIKMRESYKNNGEFRVFGFDAVGEVISKGSQVTDFQVGDKVFYAGAQMRQGSNAEYQLVDERLVALAPQTLRDEEIAAMPLTSITASEILGDAMGYQIDSNSAQGHTIFIVNGAGGVGSTLIQLAKYMGMVVITTASRPESVAWVKSLGADYILDYHQDLQVQLTKIGHDQVDNIAILQHTNAYWSLVLQTIKPFGHIVSIVETTAPIDMAPLKNRGVQFSWVFMFAKANYGIAMETQGQALSKISQLLEEGKIKSTLTKTYHGLTAENIRQATQDVESGRMIGKVVVRHNEEI